MPVNPTFPGIYVEELKASTHTITAAPTSNTVFVGYTHPYKTTRAIGSAESISNFTEFQAAYGGVFHSDHIPTELPYAVQQFFMNGGAEAYIVPLAPKVPGSPAMLFSENPPTATIEPITFTGRELVDTNTPLEVLVKNIRNDPNGPPDTKNMFDLVITYGSIATETFRGLSLRSTSPDFLEKRLNGRSSLVTVAPSTPPDYAAFTFVSDQGPTALAYPSAFEAALSSATTTYDFNDYKDQIAVADTPIDKIDVINLLVLPGATENQLMTIAIAFVERKRAFLIMDAPSNVVADDISDPSGTTIDSYINSVAGPPRTDHGALYFPWLSSTDPLAGTPMRLPPSGYVAGIFARTDYDRGVWKAPAGLETVLLNTTGVVPDGKLTDARAGLLNLQDVNALRTFKGVGTVVFGARTYIPKGGAFDQWRYVPVRRMALFLEQTLVRNLGWVIFEPNDEPLWLSIRTSIEAFMLSLFRQGAFQGSTPDQAFQVKCDSTTTTQTDIDNGIVNILVAFAPLKPAEFVVIQIAQLAGQAQT